MKRLLLVAALGLSVAHASACGSDARATDACRRIESTRCERAPQCPAQFPDFTKTYGDVGSCQRFYDTQCGRGIQEIAKEPSRSELDGCITQIKTSCDAVYDPAKFCPFLTANDTPAVVDSGVADTGTPATDAPVDGG
jgi:hypothetical protein